MRKSVSDKSKNFRITIYLKGEHRKLRKRKLRGRKLRGHSVYTTESGKL